MLRQSRSLKLALADRNPLFAAGIASLLGAIDLEVIALEPTAEALIHAVRRQRLLVQCQYLLPINSMF